jgi:radical SAM superfamily enzyme YgiQ (UPF0313 family)
VNILLISPNTLIQPYPVYPIGLDYVAGAISEEHEVKIADMLVLEKDELAGIIHDFSPDIIGVSCRNIDNTDACNSQYFLNDYQQLVKWLRARTTAVIVIGGSGFTIMPEAVFSLLGVDYGVIGEGERFSLLVDALAGKGDPAKVPGIISKDSAAGSCEVWQGKQVRKFPRDSGNKEFYLENGGMLNLQTKRGCSFRCIYCPYPRIEGRVHRLVDPRNVAQTALELQDAGAKYLFFTDSAFNSDIDQSLVVARALEKAGLRIPWGAFFAPLKLPRDYFRQMARAGCRHVEFGTESLSNTMLKSYRKPFQAEDVMIAHDQARSARLHVAHYFLFGGPGESAATVQESLEGIERLKRSVFFLFTGIRIYPGTPLFDIAVAEGKLDEDTDLLSPVFYKPSNIDLEAIEDLVGKRAQGRKNWITGSGGEQAAETIRFLHGRGLVGPLWEYLVG